MGELAGVMNRLVARGRIVGMGRNDFGQPRFILYVRTDRNGRRPRRGQQEAPHVDENAQSTAVTQEEGQQGGGSAQAPRRREEPEGIYASFAYGSQIPMDLRIGDNVEVEGHVEAYFARNRVWDNRYSYIQYLVADKVEHSKTRIEEVFGLKAGFYTGRSVFELSLRGTIADISEVPGWKVLTLAVGDNAGRRRSSSIRAQYSTKARINSTGVEKGDEVVVIASLVTRRKEIGGTTRIFENILVEDMSIVKKEAFAGDIDEDAEDLFSALDDEEESGEAPAAETAAKTEAEEPAEEKTEE